MRGPWLCLALALAGCASPDGAVPVGSATPVAVRSSSEELLNYATTLKTMSEASLATEAARQKRQSGDIARVKAAMALAVSPQSDDAEIIALVEPVSRRESADPGTRAMASFLHAMATERRRLKESAAAAGKRLADERRATEAQKQRAEALQERAVQLQQKLDALTELEKSLSDRQSPSR